MDINEGLDKGIQGLLIFILGNKEFCSDIKNITAVIKIDEIKLTYVNKFNDEIYYEGRSFKVIDIHDILKIQMKKLTNNSRIILFNTFGKIFGFITDKVSEIITIDSIFQEKYLDLIPVSKVRYINGELLFQKRRVFLLDFESLSKELKTLQKFNLGTAN